MSVLKNRQKSEKTGENILFWEKGLTLYVGYGMNDVDDVCQAGGQIIKQIEVRKPSVTLGKKCGTAEGAKGESAEVSEQVRWLRGWDAAEYAADCHFCGALSKKYIPVWGCFPAKKSRACGARRGLFLWSSQAVLPLWVTQGTQS